MLEQIFTEVIKTVPITIILCGAIYWLVLEKRITEKVEEKMSLKLTENLNEIKGLIQANSDAYKDDMDILHRERKEEIKTLYGNLQSKETASAQHAAVIREIDSAKTSIKELAEEIHRSNGHKKK
mgnify:CR=1 FL=1